MYITTNSIDSVLYTGVTNSLEQRISEHYIARGNEKTFAGRYFSYLLLFYEAQIIINRAIAREKEIKGWLRAKKEELIKFFNPERQHLNKELFGR